jgi:hypothetical protein
MVLLVVWACYFCLSEGKGTKLFTQRAQKIRIIFEHEYVVHIVVTTKNCKAAITFGVEVVCFLYIWSFLLKSA